MKQTFKLPITGEMTIEGANEDVYYFFQFLRTCVNDAAFYNYVYAECPTWGRYLNDVYEDLPEPSPYADPKLDLPF